MMKGVEQSNQVIIRSLREKETYKFWGIMEADTIKKVEMKAKFKKEYFRRTKKTTRDKSLSQESCQKDKSLGRPPHKILGTILEVDQRRT